MDDKYGITIDDGSKLIDFEIDGITYQSVTSIGKLLLPDSKNNSFNCREFVSAELFNSIASKDKPKLETIKCQKDGFFEQIFDAFLSANSAFYLIYDNIECDEICEHYAVAYTKYCAKPAVESADEIKCSTKNTMSELSKSVSEVMPQKNTSLRDALSSLVVTFLSWYVNNQESILSRFSTALESFENFSRSMVSGLASFIESIQITTVSDERKAELLKSYTQWGKYGWTVPPNAKINCFNDFPHSQQEADKIALQYCKPEDMSLVFGSLEEQCIRKRDIREAIDCYKSHNYKACALILFSIIDSRVIRMQSRKSEKYAVGIGAINKFKEFAKTHATGEAKLFLALSYSNLFPCLFTVFEDTDNFKKKVTVINRNYLNHGMTYKIVRKKDCIKLFLLLYNLIEFIDIIK